MSDGQPPWMHGDAIVATADLVGRTGATGFEIGYVHDDVPVEEAGWYAHATFKGTRIMADEHRSPSGAALGLAEKLLAGGRCRCGQTVTLDDDRPGCRWRLMGQRWEPSCDVPSVSVPKHLRGDMAGMQALMNRKDRRAARRTKN